MGMRVYKRIDTNNTDYAGENTIRIISVFISEELQRKGYSTFPMLKFSGYLPLKFL
ncbi:hypothetical protein EH215_00656 [Phocaeicola vulgatus]|nr:hypothetical protein EH215_00656 [Phocaeicola vulgatus]